jgi:hypothetical protein
VRDLCFFLPERGYHLLLGLRRARYWSSVRPRAFDAGFVALRRTFTFVVCDLEADFEGEEDGGSIDVEERNHMARAAVSRADLVLAVGRPGVKGMHALVRVLGELAAAGVPLERVVPILNATAGSARRRAELVTVLTDLASPLLAGAALPAPLFLPSRRVDEALRDGVELPAPLPGRLAGAVHGLLGAIACGADANPGPRPVVPGSLGSWYGEEAG